MKVKLMSWNIWCGVHLEDVISYLKSAQADVIALQEVCVDERGNLAEVIARELGYHYAHAVGMRMAKRFIPTYPADQEGTMPFGTAILSRFPINESMSIELSSQDGRLITRADIECHGKSIHFYSVHLKHTHQESSELQDVQAASLIDLVKDHSVIMGDFNALPESPVIEKLSKAFTNTETGTQTITWPLYKEGCICAPDRLSYKLDYVFTTKDLLASDFTVHNSRASDHLPLSVILELS